MHAARTLISVHRANFRKCREDIEVKRKEVLLEKKEKEQGERKKKSKKKKN